MSLSVLCTIASLICAAFAALIHAGKLTGLGSGWYWLVAAVVLSSLAHVVYGKVFS